MLIVSLYSLYQTELSAINDRSLSIRQRSSNQCCQYSAPVFTLAKSTVLRLS